MIIIIFVWRILCFGYVILLKIAQFEDYSSVLLFIKKNVSLFIFMKTIETSQKEFLFVTINIIILFFRYINIDQYSM